MKEQDTNERLSVRILVSIGDSGRTSIQASEQKSIVGRRDVVGERHASTALTQRGRPPPGLACVTSMNWVLLGSSGCLEMTSRAQAMNGGMDRNNKHASIGEQGHNPSLSLLVPFV